MLPSATEYIRFRLMLLLYFDTERIGVDSATIQTTQIAVQSLEGTIGLDSSSVQLGWSIRPERLVIRSLITAFMIASGPPGESRRQIIQPLYAG